MGGEVKETEEALAPPARSHRYSPALVEYR